MKILQIINDLSTGGAEKLILDSVPLYQKKGLTVDVLLLNNTETQFKSHLKETSKGKIDGLTIGSIYNPFLIFKIIPYLKKYDIIHFHLFPTLYWVVIAKWISFSKVKLVYTEHSTNNKRRGNRVFKILDKFIYNSLDKIVTIADDVDMYLKEHINLPLDKLQIINNGVDVEYYHAAEPYLKSVFFNNDDFILIQVSSFRYPKDQKTLIRCLLFLPEKMKLLLVGDGPLIRETKALVEELKLKERVKFLGNRNDVSRLLNTSDIVVLSSIYEGLSLSSIEGMSVGKPFISSNVQGLREIVDGYGLLFEQGNHEELANIILSLYNNSEFYNKIAEQCYLRAKEFDIQTMIKQYIQLYNNIV